VISTKLTLKSEVILGPLRWTNLRRRADLNYVMARVQNNAEQIALLEGGNAELLRWEQILDRTILTRRREQCLQVLFGALSTGVAGLCFLYPGWLMLQDVLKGELTVPVAWGYSSMLQSIMFSMLGIARGLAIIINNEQRARQMMQLVDMSSYLVGLEESRKHLVATSGKSQDLLLVHEHEAEENPEAELELRDVTLRTPGADGQRGKVLLENLSFRLKEHESLLIQGGTGMGKSALLLSIHGLWVTGRGTVHRCPSDGVFCVPQRPYMFVGSLRENLVYPLTLDAGAHELAPALAPRTPETWRSYQKTTFSA